ncbi:DUF488 domain-containing protein [Gluconacetobacter asukensis]|uniref:DUF488 domain-containing protein n=1 Tax=Gluconacetobacter asukensis TaxID=1017181 RepID=A0A7W4IYD5_9PROT|nr:DUF488 domain-containing protein [Gluconacetobacter asukensis]MBB2171335.1 DUF488 domain-containing protein [Gluconacetobacter asukensis]
MTRDHLPDVRTRRVYEAPEPGDGVRVLVDRLWPRGMRKADLPMDLWLKDAAPSPDLRRWFGHDPARWEAFEDRYRQELAAGNADVTKLVDLARHGTLTLLYAARDPAHHHALVLQGFVRAAVSRGRGGQGPLVQA